jgi:TetR/AcrR family transcriptional repressor of nem operon
MTKQLLINEALDIVQKEAFSALSFQLLADRVGIKKASVYYHFPSKEKLAVGVIEDATNKLGKYFTSIALQKPDKQLASYIKLFSVHISSLQNLCPGVSFITSWPAQTDLVKEAIKMLYRTHIEFVTVVIQKGYDQSIFLKNQTPAADIASTIFAMLQGALLSARVNGNQVVFDTCEKSINTLLQVDNTHE